MRFVNTSFLNFLMWSLCLFQFCKRLGWAGTNGNFDILPLVLSDENHSPTLYDIPEEIIKRVKIVHPE